MESTSKGRLTVPSLRRKIWPAVGGLNKGLAKADNIADKEHKNTIPVPVEWPALQGRPDANISLHRKCRPKPARRGLDVGFYVIEGGDCICKQAPST